MDFLKSAVASAIAKSSSFPYTIGDRIDNNNESIWTVNNAIKKDDGSACCLFTFDVNANKARLPLAKNAARKLRTLRHPGVIKVVDVIENETHIYVATEKVSPLSWDIKRKSLSEETIKWGLYTVASTLKFINTEASSVHGSVRVSSVFTNASGEWKLGGFEVLSSMNEDDAIIYNYGTLLPDSNRYAPPEVAGGGWTVIKKNPLSAADSYGLGVLIYEVFNGSFHGADQLAQPKSIPGNMAQVYRRLINNSPKIRLSPAHFVEQGKKPGSFFDSPLIHITEGADSLGLKNEEERQEFLNELDGLTDDFPEEFFKMRILPELLKSVEFGGGGPSVFTAIMKIGLKLSEDEFEARLVPVVIRLFSSPDRAMRACLLDNLPRMIDRIPQKDVSNKIWPPMTTGFTDTAPVIREQTVKAVLAVIGKLSDRIINGELLKLLAKTANDEQPGIRTNTTICLGKIAKNLGTGSRSKVLIAAFTRSLRDPFVHARNAALLALNATIDVFSDDDCATKILPAICASLVDREKMVRDQANKAMELYLQRVRKYAATLPDTVLPPEQGAQPATSAARIGNQNDTSWAGWAISSFTNKLTAARGEMESTPAAPKLVQTQSLPPSGRATPTLQVIAAEKKPGPLHRPVSEQAQRSSARSSIQEDEPAEIEDPMDAWGTMDDEEDNFFDAPAAQKKASTTTTAANAFEDKGEPDFAGWLASQNKSKVQGSPSKAQSKTTNGSNSNLTVRPGPARSISAGAGVNRAPVKKTLPTRTVAAAPAVKKAPAATKDPDPTDDDWGEAWD